MFETNLKELASVFSQAQKTSPKLFMLALSSAAMLGDDDYGMPVIKLDENDQKRFADAVFDFGVKNVSLDDMTYYYSRPTQAYLDKLGEKGEDSGKHDKIFIREYNRGYQHGAVGNWNDYDGRFMLLVYPDDMDKYSAMTGIEKEKFIKTSVAHELAHKLVPTLYIKEEDFPTLKDIDYENPESVKNIDMAALEKLIQRRKENELVADYVASKVTDFESAFFMQCFRAKYLEDNDTISRYALLQDVLKSSFEKVISVIDERLARDMRNGAVENPCSRFLEVIRGTKYRVNMTNMKAQLRSLVSKFYDDNIRNKGFEVAPPTPDLLMLRIINQYGLDVEVKAKDFMKLRLPRAA